MGQHGPKTHPKALVMAKGSLGAFAERLVDSYAVLAPIDEGGVTRFAPISGEASIERPSIGEAPIGMPGLTKRPLKEMFFPQEEALFAFDSGGAVKVEGTPEEGPMRVAFGVRPCDARSLTLLDLVFEAEGYTDPYYAGRRRNTALVTFACDSPGPGCFCASLEAGPFDETGSDLMLADIGDAFLVKVLTVKGDSLVRGFPLLQEAKDEHLEAFRRAEAASRGLVEGRVPVSAAVERLRRAGSFSDPAWEDVYRKCLGCAVCTYLCPTCHCFDIGDEAVDARGERVRNWDSCMFPLFTLHASGHNPRPSRKERFRQRLMHKFGYFVENNGCIACVGCGRCVENCPVNLDVRRVLDTFATG